MTPLPDVPEAIAMKYCGGGWGGYSLYLFPDVARRDAFVQRHDAIAIEPFLRRRGTMQTDEFESRVGLTESMV